MPISPSAHPGVDVSRQVRAFAWAVAGLLACYGSILARLGQFAFEREFNSYIVLVPIIALGLAWTKGHSWPAFSEPRRSLGIAFSAAGLLALGCYWGADRTGVGLLNERLALGTLSFVLLLVGVAAWFLGRQTLRAIAFPLAFLLCMIPLPDSLTTGLEHILQHASASVANIFFQMSDLPVFRRDDLDFQLPGITLQVAPECSGIQSSVALLVVSLAAGYVFLRSPWKRALLCVVVIPISIIRNALRINTIGELCAHLGPQMIDSYIHRQGGWIFFLASLVPFFILTYFLARSEQRLATKIQA